MPIVQGVVVDGFTAARAAGAARKET